MEITSTTTKRVRADGVQKRRLATRLSMYTAPPGQDVSLDEFEELAYNRLQVLKAIESAYERGLKGEEFKSSVRPLIEKKLRLRYSGDQRKDNISHFTLRLAYCRTEEKRRWFLTQECNLFRYRFLEEGPKEIDAFMKRYQLSFEQISAAEREQFDQQLRQNFAANHRFKEQFDNRFFKVPFEKAVGMLEKRQVFVHNGFAFVPQDKLLQLILRRFRSQLSKSLSMAVRVLPVVLRDSRVAPLLKNISQQYVGKDFNNRMASGTVKPDMIDGLSKRSFPVCMSNLHENMRRNHHLKYEGRMQYRLFLKGIGLSLEDALRFWKGEFTKAMTAEDFDKKYAYNVRHTYGKEGKRADYTPYSCRRIIMGSAPATGQSHGCPFKHWDEQNLRAKLSKLRVSSGEVDEIIDTVKSQDYQIACRLHFQATHKNAAPQVLQDVGNHPNGWFEASMAHYGDETVKSAGDKMAVDSSFNAPTEEPTAPAAAAGADAEEKEDI